MKNESKSSGGGFWVVIIIVILIFVCKNDSSEKKVDTSKNNVEQSVNNDAWKAEKQKSESNKKVVKLSEDDYKKAFLKSSKEFYNLYIDELGSDYDIDSEEYNDEGEFVGNNKEVCLQLGELLKEMCESYSKIKKQGDREDLLVEILEYGPDFDMHTYITNIGQMVMLITGDTWYNHELFVHELNDYIAY